LVQQDFQQQDYQQEYTETNHTSEVVDSGAAEQRQRAQEDFHQQQLVKQQQGAEMRQERQSNNSLVPGGPGDSADLPPNFQHCSLKGRPFTPTMDLSIHNTQGIDVWTTKGPKPFGMSGTVTRTAIKQAKSGELPPQPSKPQQQAQQPAALAVPQVAICPATPAVNESELIVSSQQHQSSTSAMSSSSSVTTVQQGVNSIDLEEQKRREYEQWFKTQEREQQALEYDCSVKYEATATASKAQSTQQSSTQEVATHTKITQNKDEVDRAKMEQVKREKEIREEQQRVEQMKREQEMKQQQMRQEQERQLALEQQRLANEAREEALRVQKQLEQQEREQHAREQQMREQQLREEEMRKQQLRDQQMQEQQMREQQMKEQQMKEQQMREQQMREQQVREQQMREQQMRDQQMRDQQMQQQQMQQQQMQQQQMQQQQMQQQQMQQQQMQQQHFQQQQTNMSRTTTETSSFSQQQSLHESNLSMQVKSGGFINGGQGQQVEGYTSSLKPTSEGELIRTQGDLQYSQTNMQQSGMEQVQLRKTSGTKDIKDTVRQSGVFVGIAGDHNALVSEMFDNEKHSVSDMVKHFSKIKPGDIPQNIMPQHYQMQHAPPSLSELQDQAKDRQFSYQKKDQVDSSSTMTYKEQKEAEEKAKLFERRTSLKDFMLMEGEKSSNINIIDPSNILQVDGSVEGKKLYNGTRRTASGRELDSQGRLTDTDKWDNHNAIARGWKNVEDNYRPVTFRGIYGVEKQAPTPIPGQRTPKTSATPVASQMPSGEPEGESDL